MDDADAPPPEEQKPGAPISRLDAFGNELIAMMDRHMKEGGLDITQILGTIEYTKWKFLKHLDAITEGDADAN